MIRHLSLLFTLATSALALDKSNIVTADSPSDVTVVDLRCEGLVDPIGIDVAKPQLSWQMRSVRNGAAQSAYQLRCSTSPALLAGDGADFWDSGKVDGNRSQGIVYGGQLLPRGNPIHWQVRIWDDMGKVSAWSTPAVWTHFDMFKDEDWQAKWITTDASSPWFRGIMNLDDVPKRAFVYINALGYFHLYINGERVGEDEFTPHVAQYDKRTFCITYDVTKHLRKGRNVVAIWMGSGWNQRGAGIGNKKDFDPEITPTVRAQLEVVDIRGKASTLFTDETWRAKASSHAYTGKWEWGAYGGEIHDGAKDLPNWACVEFDDSDWPRARLAHSNEKLAASLIPGRPVSAEMLQRNRIIETLTPVKVTQLEPSTWLVDMGKAMTGTFEITFPQGEAGRKILMEFGDNFLENENTVKSFGQASEYIYRGSGVEQFKNRFNYASCQYILIKNVPEGEITPEDAKGHLITTDLPSSATFECSNETLNAIFRMMMNTLRCLMLGGYQTDCHSRERFGYGGDGHSSLDTTLSLLRSDAFYRKSTRDWVDQQQPDGVLTHTTPASHHGGGPFWPGFLTAATLKHYQHYNDLSVVRHNYPAIKKWFELAQSKIVDGIQQKFTGQKSYLGDWASPEGIHNHANAELFIQAYMAYELENAAQLAEILANREDALAFRQWAAARKEATHKAFYDREGTKYGSGDQVTYVLPLIAGLVPKDQTEKVFAAFENTLATKDKGHLSTGLSGTYMMIQYLQSIGRHDLIYLFASKTTFPSWGHMIENGATATWEHWSGKASRIHNCYNSIGAWFIQGLAGIRPNPKQPGFQNAIIEPAFIKELNFVKGSHDSLYGTIESHWVRNGDVIDLSVRIPANSTASVYLPVRALGDITVNGKPVGAADHVSSASIADGKAFFQLASGSYKLTIRPCSN